MDETPDYTDSDTNPNTTASSVVGDPVTDGRKRRTEVNQLRRSIFGRKHDALGESKVRISRDCPSTLLSSLIFLSSFHIFSFLILVHFVCAPLRATTDYITRCI